MSSAIANVYYDNTNNKIVWDYKPLDFTHLQWFDASNTNFNFITTDTPNIEQREISINYNNESFKKAYISDNNEYIETAAFIKYFNNDISNSFKNIYNNNLTNFSDVFSKKSFQYVQYLNESFAGSDYLVGNFFQIPNAINMYNAFAGCANLGGTGYCGNYVTNFEGAYTGTNIDYAECGSQVTSLANTFAGCTNLRAAAENMNKVINMYNAYSNCKLLKEAVCGDNVVNLDKAYKNCDNINVIQIGNNVTSMFEAFLGDKLITAPLLGSNVTNASRSYSYCLNIVNGYINGNKLTDINEIFASPEQLSYFSNLNSLYINDDVNLSENNMLNLITIQDISKPFNIYLGNNLQGNFNIRNIFQSRNSEMCYNGQENGEQLNFVYSLSIGENINSIVCNDIYGISFNINVNNENIIYTAPGLQQVTFAKNSNIISLNDAFVNCHNLKNILYLPNNLTYLVNTFKNCDDLQGDIYLYSLEKNEQKINLSNCFTGRNNANQLNIWLQKDRGIDNAILKQNMFSIVDSFVDWTNFDNGQGYFNTDYNINVYYYNSSTNLKYLNCQNVTSFTIDKENSILHQKQINTTSSMMPAYSYEYKEENIYNNNIMVYNYQILTDATNIYLNKNCAESFNNVLYKMALNNEQFDFNNLKFNYVTNMYNCFGSNLNNSKYANYMYIDSNNLNFNNVINASCAFNNCDFLNGYFPYFPVANNLAYAFANCSSLYGDVYYNHTNYIKNAKWAYEGCNINYLYVKVEPEGNVGELINNTAIKKADLYFCNGTNGSSFPIQTTSREVKIVDLNIYIEENVEDIGRKISLLYGAYSYDNSWLTNLSISGNKKSLLDSQGHNLLETRRLPYLNNIFIDCPCTGGRLFSFYSENRLINLNFGQNFYVKDKNISWYFYNYYALEEPYYFKNIENAAYAYVNCNHLKNIYMEDSIINGYAMYECHDNPSLTGNPKISANMQYMDEIYHGQRNLTGLGASGPKVKSMMSAYSNCSNLTSAEIGENVIEASWAFENCDNIGGYCKLKFFNDYSPNLLRTFKRDIYNTEKEYEWLALLVEKNSAILNNLLTGWTSAEWGWSCSIYADELPIWEEYPDGYKNAEAKICIEFLDDYTSVGIEETKKYLQYAYSNVNIQTGISLENYRESKINSLYSYENVRVSLDDGELKVKTKANEIYWSPYCEEGFKDSELSDFSLFTNYFNHSKIISMNSTFYNCVNLSNGNYKCYENVEDFTYCFFDSLYDKAINLDILSEKENLNLFGCFGNADEEVYDSCINIYVNRESYANSIIYNQNDVNGIIMGNTWDDEFISLEWDVENELGYFNELCRVNVYYKN